MRSHQGRRIVVIGSWFGCAADVQRLRVGVWEQGGPYSWEKHM
ncbi:hypothetical protein ALCH109712_09775 [Alkalicoccus chagannorensis]